MSQLPHAINCSSLAAHISCTTLVVGVIIRIGVQSRNKRALLGLFQLKIVVWWFVGRLEINVQNLIVVASFALTLPIVGVSANERIAD